SPRGEEYRRVERIEWSPDGRRLTFSEARGPFPSGDLGYAIWSLAPGGRAERVLAQVNPAAWDGSPDGRWVAFKASQGPVRDPDMPPGLWICRRDGTSRQRLVPTREDSSWLDFPAWSPDGRQIAYFFGKHGPPSFLALCVVDRRGQVTTLWRQRDAGFA